jgi:hypothetical protein
MMKKTLMETMMKKTLAALALAATTALSTGALAEEITEFRIGFWAAKTRRTA